MPRDKSKSHEKVVAAAFDEFLAYGFKDASMRRIAAACGMSASGLYKHFSDKEEMFVALVEPAYEGLKSELFSKADEGYENLDLKEMDEVWEESGDTVRVIRYVYKHYNAFKLLVCRSQGTRFENYIHELAELEENSTRRYLERLNELGAGVKMIPEKEMHLLVTTNITAIFQTVEHDFSEREAMSYAKHLDVFCENGWRKLLEIDK